jgi:hypothetical protein
MSSWFMDKVLTDMIGRGYESLRLLQDAPEAYTAVAFAAQTVGYLYLFIAGFVPVLVARGFRRLPPSTQELLEKRRIWLMLLPTAFVGVGIFTPILSNFFSSSSDFPAMNLHSLFLYFIGLNLCSTYYQEMSLNQKLDDLFMNPTARQVVTGVAWFLFLTTILLGVSA